MKSLDQEKNQAILQELQVIQQSSGVLQAEAVVDYAAKHKSSALHDEFEWDDTEAARQYRLEQARGIIQRVWVTVEGIEDDPIRVRAFHSLVSDRVEPGGGYRTLREIMTDPEKRKELLQEALDEYKRLEEKYTLLTELAPLFKVRKKLAKRYGKGGNMSVTAHV